MTYLFKTCAEFVSNPNFIQGLVCGVSLFLVPKVVYYYFSKSTKVRKTKRGSEKGDHNDDEEEEEEEDDDSVNSDEFEDIDSADDLEDSIMYGEEMKLMLIVRTDLGMGKGKAAAQCAHAAVQAYRQASVHAKKFLKVWCTHGQPKVAVKVDSEAELLRLATESRKKGLITSLISDAGRTQIQSGSKTVLGIGPAPKSQLDILTGHLKLY